MKTFLPYLCAGKLPQMNRINTDGHRYGMSLSPMLCVPFPEGTQSGAKRADGNKGVHLWLMTKSTVETSMIG
jgi:hypothetical protein